MLYALSIKEHSCINYEQFPAIKDYLKFWYRMV